MSTSERSRLPGLSVTTRFAAATSKRNCVKADVLIVGAGIVGTSCAYVLARAGARVEVVDATLAGRATQAATGMISPGTVMLGEANVPPGFLTLAFQSGAFHTELHQWLVEDGEKESSYAQVGSLIVARDESEAEQLPALARALRQRREAGVGLIGEVEMLGAGAARKLFPPLDSGLAGAIHIADAARVDGRRLLATIKRAAVRRGATFIRGVCRLESQAGGRPAVVTIDGERRSDGPVILTTGAWWLGAAVAGLPAPPVKPLRGQVVHLRLEGCDTTHWPTVRGFTETSYMVPFPGGRVVVGATRDQTAGFDARVTAQATHQVLHGALSIAPGLAQATVLEQRVGLRPLASDGLPTIGRLTPAAEIYACTGHGAYGLLMGPRSGAAVANLCAGREPGIDLAPFDPGRFGQQIIRSEVYV